MASDFQAKIRKLNKNLHIYCQDSDRPAGLYLVSKTGEVEELCGVDKNHIEEFPSYDRYGKMMKGGWRRAVRLLVAKGYANRHFSYKLFGWYDEHRAPPYNIEKNEIDRAVGSMQVKGYKRIENPLCAGEFIDTPVYDNDEVVDIGRMIHANK